MISAQSGGYCRLTWVAENHQSGRFARLGQARGRFQQRSRNRQGRNVTSVSRETLLKKPRQFWSANRFRVSPETETARVLNESVTRARVQGVKVPTQWSWTNLLCRPR